MKRLARYLGAVTTLPLSGWLLLGYYGLKTTAQDRAQAWNIDELPSHPQARMFLYLAGGLALPFLAAWLSYPRPMATVDNETLANQLWRSFAFRLCLSFVCSLLFAFLLAFLVMALLDAGVI
jgi:hypothetical protein